jgi:hypothetical protein
MAREARENVAILTLKIVKYDANWNKFARSERKIGGFISHPPGYGGKDEIGWRE